MQPVDEPYAKVEIIEKISLIKLLRLLVIDMRTAAIHMAKMEDYEWLRHAYELTGAADMVVEWSRNAPKIDETLSDRQGEA